MFIKRNEYSVYMNKQTLANTGFTVTFTRIYTEMFEFALAARNVYSTFTMSHSTFTVITMSIRQIRIKTESLWFHRLI